MKTTYVDLLRSLRFVATMSTLSTSLVFIFLAISGMVAAGLLECFIFSSNVCSTFSVSSLLFTLYQRSVLKGIL